MSSRSLQALPPLASRTPTTVNGTLLILIISSIGFISSKRFFTIVCPIIATLFPESNSSSSKLLPLSNDQLPRSKYSLVVPVTEDNQLLLLAKIWVLKLTCGAIDLIAGNSFFNFPYHLGLKY